MIKNYIKNYVKKTETYAIIISLLMLVLSIFLILKPFKSLEVFVILFSAIIIVNGIGSIVSYFSTIRENRLLNLGLLYGLLTILAGVLLFIYRIDVINVLPIILGIWIILSNLFKMQISINLSALDYKGWIWLLLVSILMMVVGVLLIVNPFTTTLTITTIAGIMLLISEIVNLVESIYVLIKIKKL